MKSPFITKPRTIASKEECFTTLADDAPRWLLDAVRDAHDGGRTLPDDWIFSICKAAFEDDRDLTDPDEVFAFADEETDLGTKAIYRWAADLCMTTVFSDAASEAVELLTEQDTIERRLQTIQFCAIRTIATIIGNAKHEHEEEVEA